MLKAKKLAEFSSVEINKPRSSSRKVRSRPRQKGSILIGLIITMVIMASLGGGMVYLTTTSTFQELFANNHARAYYAAESGGRYAMAVIRKAFASSSYLTDADYITLKNSSDASSLYTFGGNTFKVQNIVVSGSTTKQVDFNVTGIVNASSFLQAQRKLSYRIIPANQTGGVSGGGGGFSGPSTGSLDFNVDGSRPFTSTSNLGQYVVDDGKLQIDEVNSGQKTFFAIYPTSTAINSDYELQVKIEVRNQPEVKHMVGLTFRKQSANISPGNIASYGVSFLRGSGDGIPDLGMNGNYQGKTYIALWDTTGGAPPSGPQNLIAYKEITSVSGILNSGKLAEWPTLLVRVREETVSTVKHNIISVYYANNGTSTSGDADPTEYTNTRKGSPRNGLTDLAGAQYLPWPINNINEWTAAVDYFTVVQWDSVDVTKGTLSSDGSYANVIVKTIGATDLDFSQPQFEFGLHAFGESGYTTKVSFDDFAYRLGSTSGSGVTDGSGSVTVSP